MIPKVERSLYQLTLAAILFVGAISNSLAADRVTASEMRGRMQYRGFSVKRPPAGWYLNQREQTYTQFILRKDFRQPGHTIFLMVTLNAWTVGRTTKFADAVRQLFSKSSERGKVLSYRQSETRLQGQQAVSDERIAQDLALSRATGRTVIMRDHGIVVLHSAFPNAVLGILFSERAPKEELDDATFSLADAMMGLVTMEVQPGVPAQ